MRALVFCLCAMFALAVNTPLRASAEPHVLNFADGVDLTGLNPLQPQAAPNNEIAYLTMAYLSRYGPNGLQPELLAVLPTRRNGGISGEVIGGAGSSFVDQILELVRTNWSAIGVDVTTKRYPLSLMFGARDAGGILFGGKFDVALFSTGQTMSDEYATNFLCREIPPNGTNVSQLCDKPLDAEMDRAARIYDPAQAGTLYVYGQRGLFEDVPEIVLTLRNEYNLVRDNVTGAHWSPFAFFFDPLTIDVVK